MVTNMRLDWKVTIMAVSVLMAFCAKPKSLWVKWQESLDLAYPNVLSFKIEMKKKTFIEGEPLVFRMLISNKLDIPKSIIHNGDRTSMIVLGLQTFKVVTELDSVLMYSGYSHADAFQRPEDVIVLGSYDTLYFYAILCPDIFRQYEFPRTRVSLISGNYIIESDIHLGTKFYPKLGRALNITSHPSMFSIESLPNVERDNLTKIRPYIKSFFGNAEHGLWPEDDNDEKFADSALFWLDKIRNTDSYFAPLADFVYTCIPAVTRTYRDTLKLYKAISDGKKFIEKYNGSILAEEMEFKLARWFFLKDSLGTEFYEQAKKVVEKYPKNINSFGVRKHIPDGL